MTNKLKFLKTYFDSIWDGEYIEFFKKPIATTLQTKSLRYRISTDMVFNNGSEILLKDNIRKLSGITSVVENLYSNGIAPIKSIPYLKEIDIEPLDSDAITFMTATGIPNDSTIFYTGTPQEKTGAQLWTIISDLVKELKGQGTLNTITNFWTDKNLRIFHPIIGGTAFTHKFNLKNPATYQINFQGGWVHSRTGARPNGTNAYGDIGIKPTDLNASNLNFGRFNGSMLGASGVELGASNAGNDDTWAVFSNYGGHFHFTTDDYTIYANDANGLGAYWLNILSATQVTGYRQGVSVGTTTQAATVLNSNFYYGALNNGGTPGFFDSKELQQGHFLDGLSPSEANLYYNIIFDYQLKLGRVNKQSHFFGDSTTEGVGASVQSNRWSSLVATAKNWTEVNYAVQGTTLENSTPLNPISSPNMYENRNAIPTYIPGSMGALFISYSINDCGLNVAGYNTTLYSTQLGEIIDVAISKGWPLNRIVLVIGFLCTELNWNDYLAYGVGVPATNARHLTFINAAQVVATAKGVVMVNPYQDMLDSGIYPPDGRHPNDFLYDLIADKVITTIAAL